MEIRTATAADNEAIRQIFNREVETESTVLELRARSEAEQAQWLDRHSGAYAVIVAVQKALSGGEAEEAIAGFASLSPYRIRDGYKTTAESSVYVHAEHREEGIGRALMDMLIELGAHSGFHTLIARIADNNKASASLHEACGFELIGVEKEVGRKFQKWIDCAIYQKMLNTKNV